MYILYSWNITLWKQMMIVFRTEVLHGDDNYNNNNNNVLKYYTVTTWRK